MCKSPFLLPSRHYSAKEGSHPLRKELQIRRNRRLLFARHFLLCSAIVATYLTFLFGGPRLFSRSLDRHLVLVLTRFHFFRLASHHASSCDRILNQLSFRRRTHDTLLRGRRIRESARRTHPLVFIPRNRDNRGGFHSRGDPRQRLRLLHLPRASCGENLGVELCRSTHDETPAGMQFPFEDCLTLHDSRMKRPRADDTNRRR